MHDQATTVIAPGAPARVLAGLIPVAAVALIASSAARGGLERSAQDVVAPSLVAAATIAVALVLAVRALTQRGELAATELRCRNLVTSFAIPWDDVEALIVRRRPMSVQIEIRARHHRRAHRLGAATRFDGDGAVAMLTVLQEHQRAGAVLEDSAP